jgi:23S rRNA pseudouridine2605 synthase
MKNNRSRTIKNKTDKSTEKTKNKNISTDKQTKKSNQTSGKLFVRKNNEKDKLYKPTTPYKPHHKKKKSEPLKENDGSIRLNRYIANAGICSRREADKLIEAGVIKVNGKVVTQLGTKVFPGDKVMYGEQTLSAEKLVYILLNKPKDYITTADDPQGRKTVMELVKNASRERIYPVGRLDRNTTGLLLFTNDGELATKLTHPKNNIKKIYHVVTDKNVSKTDLQKLKQGIELEDGFIKVDDIQFVGNGSNKRDIGVEIHSGRNRIVRRMFEHLGYKIIKLDRVMFAGLTKKDLPRGKFRALTQQEINFLKMI